MPEPSSLTRWFIGLFRSFGYAWAGILEALRTQRNLQIHATISPLAIGLGVFVALSPTEWAVLLLTIGVVWSAELLNTAVEILCDRITREQDDSIRRVKDIAAGAVLIVAIAACGVGLLLFLPKLLPILLP